MGSYRPQARKDDLAIQPIDKELVVFDSRLQQGHSLNSSAAQVLDLCDGNHTPSEIAHELGVIAGTDVDEELVQLALEELGKAGLLIEPPPESQPPIVDRRRFIETAVLALPAIATILLAAPDGAESEVKGGRPAAKAHGPKDPACRNPGCKDGWCSNNGCPDAYCQNKTCRNEWCPNPECLSNAWCTHSVCRNPYCLHASCTNPNCDCPEPPTQTQCLPQPLPQAQCPPQEGCPQSFCLRPNFGCPRNPTLCVDRDCVHGICLEPNCTDGNCPASR